MLLHPFEAYLRVNYIQGETELSFRLIPSLTQSHTKSHAKTVREEVILAKEGISLKDNSVSPCMYILELCEEGNISSQIRKIMEIEIFE